MALVSNPFDTQHPAPSSTGIVNNAIAGEPAAVRPATREIDPTRGTVQGQVNSILSQDGQLMQRARTSANEQMAGRGLLNSSMAVEAGQAAVMDRAMPMAQQDANAYNQADSENMGATNQATQFNAGAVNQRGLQKSDQTFTAGQNDIQRATQEKIQATQIASTEGMQKAQSDQQASQFAANQAMQADQNKTQASQFASNQAMQADQNKTQDAQFQSNQDAQFKQIAIQHANALEQLGVANNFARAQVPTQFAAGVAASTSDKVNAILSDGSLTPQARKAAIDNVTAYANSSIAWAEKVYSVSIPGLSTPAAVSAPEATSTTTAPKVAAPNVTYQPVDTGFNWADR